MVHQSSIVSVILFTLGGQLLRLLDWDHSVVANIFEIYTLLHFQEGKVSAMQGNNM